MKTLPVLVSKHYNSGEMQGGDISRLWNKKEKIKFLSDSAD